MQRKAGAAGEKKASGFEGSVGELDEDGEESDGAVSEGCEDSEADVGAGAGDGEDRRRFEKHQFPFELEMKVESVPGLTLFFSDSLSSFFLIKKIFII